MSQFAVPLMYLSSISCQSLILIGIFRASDRRQGVLPSVGTWLPLSPMYLFPNLLISSQTYTIYATVSFLVCCALLPERLFGPSVSGSTLLYLQLVLNKRCSVPPDILIRSQHANEVYRAGRQTRRMPKKNGGSGVDGHHYVLNRFLQGALAAGTSCTALLRLG